MNIKLIAHRGNLNGPSPYENRLDQVLSAIDLGFDVEVDVWYIDGRVWFGHDHPKYLIAQELFNKIIPSSWLHCKNVEAMEFLSNHFMSPNFFWHENDKTTLTSHKYIWTYPGEGLTAKSIAVMPELTTQKFDTIPFGICTDYPIAYKKLFQG